MSLSDDFNINALKDTYDYSCFLARLDEYRHLMTYLPSARRVPSDFWDLYQTEDIAMPQHRLPPEDMPGIAWKQDGFYRASDTVRL